jgi:hypothetical protein
MAAALVSIYTTIIVSSPLFIIEPNIRDLRAVALISGIINNKKTDTISTLFKYRIVTDRRYRNSYT